MHAADKLREADFFLGLLRNTVNRAEFRYFLSAFLSASRSVTYALQKDLRSTYGDRFDKWYEEKARQLASHPIGSVVQRVRTVFQKEGNKLYVRQTYASSDGLEPTIRVEFNLEHVPLTPDSFTKIDFEFPSGAGAIGLGVRRDGGIQEWLESNLTALMARFSERIAREPGDWEVAIEAGAEPRSPEELCTSFESYVRLLQQVVTEAKDQFDG